MCSILCRYDPNRQYRVVFLENRDRPVEGFEGNDVRLIDHGKVVCIFDYRSKGVATGYSISNGIFGGVVNIPGYTASKSRGHLLRDVLTEARNLREGLEILVDGAKTGRYSSASYLIGDIHQAYALENWQQEFYVERITMLKVITNRFKHLHYGEFQPNARERASAAARVHPFEIERHTNLVFQL